MESTWYRIEVEDPDNLSSSIFINIIKLLKKYLKNKKIFTADIHGSGISKFRFLMQYEEIIQAFEEVVQLDWGDFFFLDENNCFLPNQKMKYPEIIDQTILTIRAIDDQFINIFTKEKEIIAILSNFFIKCKINQGTLSSFDYPE